MKRGTAAGDFVISRAEINSQVPILGPEAALREIVGYIVFFTVGLICAGAYFYQLHPEHSPDADLPRVRKDVEEAVDRGRRLRDAWDRSNGSDEATTKNGG